MDLISYLVKTKMEEETANSSSEEDETSSHNSKSMVLLNLVSKYKVVSSRAPEGISRVYKKAAWKRIARDYCKQTGIRLRPKNLKTKWNNLKSAARKQNLLRLYQLRTGNEKDIVPMNKIMERVTSMLVDVEKKLEINENRNTGKFTTLELEMNKMVITNEENIEEKNLAAVNQNIGVEMKDSDLQYQKVNMEI